MAAGVPYNEGRHMKAMKCLFARVQCLGVMCNTGVLQKPGEVKTTIWALYVHILSKWAS